MRKSAPTALLLLLGAAAALPAHAVVLRYAPKVGVISKYQLTMTGQVDTSLQGLDQAMSLGITGAVQYCETALSESPDRVRVERRTTGGEITLRMGEDAETRQVPGSRMVADMDRRGRLLKIVEQDAGGRPALDDILGVRWTDLVNIGAFPESEVKVGDTWSDRLEIAGAEGSPAVTLRLTSKLLELATFQGRKCAKIRVTFDGPLTFGAAEDGRDSGSMKALLHGDGIWYYDYENGLYARAEGTVGLSMTASGSGSPGLPMTTKMAMALKLSLAD